ncbi:MAG: SUMF1/EgtB/PvdO family nonheme iron enzyme, partial [Anaerolineales bacterium]|nr:SUMF1/EgtB/PvdO family nonheme iron enzyme [Anaerolineales bacterium]
MKKIILGWIMALVFTLLVGCTPKTNLQVVYITATPQPSLSLLSPTPQPDIEHLTFHAPPGISPIIDGTISSDEWADAQMIKLSHGQLLLKQNGAYLYVGIISDHLGLGSLCVYRDEEVSVLHSSAALGTATYIQTDDEWQKTRDFSWSNRETSNSQSVLQARQRHLETENWVASNGNMGATNDMEYQIAMTDGAVRLAVTYLMSPDYKSTDYWPESLSEGCRDFEPLPGDAPKSVNFAPETWMTVLASSTSDSIGEIAFTSEMDGNMEIYRIMADGSHLQRLTDHPGEDYWPTWSPDGQQIAFASQRDENFEIYSMNADGSDLQRLTREPGNDLEPAWSPDGSKIAFMVYQSGKSDVYVMDFDGSGRKRLTQGIGDHYLPKWSPDGTQIVFVSERDGNPEIYSMLADGSDQIRLTDNPTDDLYPAWSSDGTQISFYSQRDGHRGLYVVNVDSGEVFRLTTENSTVWVSDWSPEGDRIAFTSNQDGNREIYILDIASGDLQRLTDNYVLDGIPVWRPIVSAELETAPDPIKFKYIESEDRSILPATDVRSLNGKYQDPGAVVFHDDQFHMFYNSSNSYPPDEVHIGYAVSRDGYEWERVSEQSIINEADIPYDANSILAGAVIVEPDGTWVLYFYTRDNSRITPPSRIGRATAPSPEGPWLVDPNPILEPDPSGWASTALQRPDVIRLGDIYYMYYVGVGDQNQLGMIGMATSTDGEHWTKYDNSETRDDMFALSDPIFGQTNTGLEDARIKYPRVRYTTDGWLMFYQTSLDGGRNSRLWLATSNDGISWEPIQDSPILTTAELPNGATIFMPNFVYADYTYFALVEVGFGTQTKVNLVTYQGAILDDEQRAGVPNPWLASQIIDDHDTPMILIPAGTFTMGQGSSHNGPPHTVILSDYYIDQFEVSNASFAEFLNEIGNQREQGAPWLDVSSRAEGHLHQVEGVWKPDDGYDDHPTVEVTWFGAKAYCDWRDARLPTEAEWEIAARGDNERQYPWGDEIDCDHANYQLCGIDETVPIDLYPQGASPYGVYNLAGNASEWTADWYGAYPTEKVVNPQGPVSSNQNARVVRGGSWYSTNMFLGTYYRNSEFGPLSSFPNLGFRCADSPPSQDNGVAETQHGSIVAPSANPPIIDGTLSPLEWDDAAIETLSDGSELYLMQNEGYLYLGIRSKSLELIVGNIFVDHGDEVVVLHSSAALGTAIYTKDDDTWDRTREFDWCCRSTSDSTSALTEREEFLQDEGWVANNSFMG